jgi:hypothetical protein
VREKSYKIISTYFFFWGGVIQCASRVELRPTKRVKTITSKISPSPDMVTSPEYRSGSHLETISVTWPAYCDDTCVCTDKMDCVDEQGCQMVYF